ncbi:MAG: hypothetical protein Q8K93_19675 [Reyranella sp.]|nr:hypothetical protein [Reyranella sp.]
MASPAGDQGAATAAAGDVGVGGVSFANILSDFEVREGTAKGNIDYNVAAKTRQIADENAANRRHQEIANDDPRRFSRNSEGPRSLPVQSGETV